MESHRAEFSDKALLHSLKTLRTAKSRLHLLTAGSSTQDTLISQIELCDVLLEEIRAISCSLERRMSSNGVRWRYRGSRYLAIRRDKLANRSKWRQ